MDNAEQYEKLRNELKEYVLNYLRSKNINYGLASDAMRDVLDYLQKTVWFNILN